MSLCTRTIGDSSTKSVLLGNGRALVAASVAALFGLFFDAACSQEVAAAKASLPSYMTERDGRLDASTIAWHESMWSFFVLVSSLEAQKPSQSLSLLLEDGAGLDLRTAQKVVAHIVRSVNQQQEYSRSLLAAQCAQLRGKALAAKDFAAKLVSAEAAERKHREIYFSELSQMLDDSTWQQLDSWVDSSVRSSMQIVDVDFSRMFAENVINQQLVVSRMCDQSRNK